MIKIQLINFENYKFAFTYIDLSNNFWFLGMETLKELQYQNLHKVLDHSVSKIYRKTWQQLLNQQNLELFEYCGIFPPYKIFISLNGLFELIKNSELVGKYTIITFVWDIFSDLRTNSNKMNVNYEPNEESKKVIMDIIENGKKKLQNAKDMYEEKLQENIKKLTNEFNEKYKQLENELAHVHKNKDQLMSAYKEDTSRLMQNATKPPKNCDQKQQLFIIYFRGKKQSKLSFIIGKKSYIDGKQNCKYKYTKGEIIYCGSVPNALYATINLMDAIEQDLKSMNRNIKIWRTARDIRFNTDLLSAEKIKKLFAETSMYNACDLKINNFIQ